MRKKQTRYVERNFEEQVSEWFLIMCNDDHTCYSLIFMPVLPIIRMGNPVLRQVAKEVEIADIQS